MHTFKLVLILDKAHPPTPYYNEYILDQHNLTILHTTIQYMIMTSDLYEFLLIPQPPQQVQWRGSWLVWLSHDPLPTTALGVLHHQHTDGSVWCPSIQLFVAFPKNVKLKKLDIIKCECEICNSQGYSFAGAPTGEGTGGGECLPICQWQTWRCICY